MERNSPGAEGASGTSDHHATNEICSLYITRVCSLAAVLRPSGQASAAAPLTMRPQPCATLSMLTYYRTSRSLHFPFWAVCSLPGAQPEIWSVGWSPQYIG